MSSVKRAAAPQQKANQKRKEPPPSQAQTTQRKKAAKTKQSDTAKPRPAEKKQEQQITVANNEEQLASKPVEEETDGVVWLVKKLRARIDSEEGSLEKITLASKLFHSPDMIMFNKDLFLLQWLIQTMAYSEKRSLGDAKYTPEYISVPYWTLLQQIVSISTPFRPPFAAQFPNQKDFLRLVVSTCNHSVSSPVGSELLRLVDETLKPLYHEQFFSFRPSIDIYVPFMSSFLPTFIAGIKEDLECKSETTQIITAIFVNALQLFIEIKSTHKNQRKNFTLVVSKFLEPFLVIRYFVTRSNASIRFHQILELLDGILLKTLFPNSARLFEYSLAFSFNRDQQQPQQPQQTADSAPDGEQGDNTNNTNTNNKKKKGKVRDKNKKPGQGTYKGTSIMSYRKLLFDRLRELMNERKEVVPGMPQHLLICHSLSFILAGFLDTFHNFYTAQQIKRRKLAALVEKNEEVEDPLTKEQTNRHLQFNFFLELKDVLSKVLDHDIHKISNSSEALKELHEGLDSLQELLGVVLRFDVYKENFDPEKIQLGYFSRTTERCIELLSFITSDDAAKTRTTTSTELHALSMPLFGCFSQLVQLSHYTIEPHLGTLWKTLWKKWTVRVPHEHDTFAVLLLQTYTKLRQFDVLMVTLFDSLLVESNESLDAQLLYSDEFLKEFSQSVSMLPFLKVPIIWQLFLTEISNKYLPVLSDLVITPTTTTTTKKKKKGNTAQQQQQQQQVTTRRHSQAEENILQAFSLLVHLFVSFMGGVVILNENATSLLDMVFKSCTEVVEILLPLSLGLNPLQFLIEQADMKALLLRTKGMARNAKLIYDVLSLYLMLGNVWERAVQYPSTRLAEFKANHLESVGQGCFALLGKQSSLASVSLDFLVSLLQPEANRLPQLRLVLDILSVHELRELHIAQRCLSLQSRNKTTSDEKADMDVDTEETLDGDDDEHKKVQHQIAQITGHLLEEVCTHIAAGRTGHQQPVVWDNLLGSLDATTYPVGLWKLVTENLDVLCQYLQKDQLQALLQILLIDYPPVSEDAEGEGAVSVSLVSKRKGAGAGSIKECNQRVVCKALFYELQPIRQIITRTLLGGIASAWTELYNSEEEGEGEGGGQERDGVALELLKKVIEVTDESGEASSSASEEEEGDVSFFKYSNFVKSVGLEAAFSTIFNKTKKKDNKAKKKKTKKSPRKKGKEKQEEEPQWQKVKRVRQVVDLMLALPSQYLVDGHKWCCAIVMVTIDFLSYRMRKKLLKEENQGGNNKQRQLLIQQTQKELMLLDCSCRQLLSLFVPDVTLRYDAPVAMKAKQWSSIFSNGALGWLLTSVNSRKNDSVPAALKQQIFEKTLTVQAVYCRALLKGVFYQIRNQVLQTGSTTLDTQDESQLASVVRLLLESLAPPTQATDTQRDEIAELEKILLPLRCLSGFLKTLVEEVQEKETRCAQKSKLGTAALIEEIEEDETTSKEEGSEQRKLQKKRKQIRQAIKRCFFIPQECFRLVRQLEAKYHQVLDKYSASENFALSAQTASRLLLVDSDDGKEESKHRGVNAIALDYFSVILSLYGGIMGFKRLSVSKYLGEKEFLEKRTKEEKERRNTSTDRRPPSVARIQMNSFAMMGSFLAFAGRALMARFFGNNNHQQQQQQQQQVVVVSQEKEELVLQLLEFVKLVCEQIPQFRPQLSNYQFGTLFGLLQRLMQHSFATGGRSRESRAIERAYLALLGKASGKQLGMVGEALVVEMSSAHPIHRIQAAAYAADVILSIDDFPRIARLSVGKKAETIVQYLVNAIDRMFIGDTPAEYTTESTTYIAICFNVITQLVTNKSLAIGEFTTALALRVLAPFTSQSEQFFNRGKPSERSRQQQLQQQAEDEKHLIGQKRKLSTLLRNSNNVAELLDSDSAIKQQHPLKSTSLPEPIFLSIYSLLFKMLVYKPIETIVCMPAFIAGIRCLLVSVFQYDRDENRKHKLLCAENLARLIEEMSKQPKTFNKYVAYLMMDYVLLVEANPLSQATKTTFLPGVYALMDIGTDFEYRLVYRALNATGKAIFKKIYDEYNRDWKFTGKA